VTPWARLHNENPLVQYRLKKTARVPKSNVKFVIPDEAIQIWPQKKEKLRSDFLFFGVLKASSEA
jgi:hypothetical protein